MIAKIFFYFEVTICTSQHKFPIFGIGFAPYMFKDQMTGWSNGSIGYHGDDGKVYDNKGESSTTFRKYTVNDTVGAFWDKISGEIFFVWNGEVLGRNICNRNPSLSTHFIPTITFQGGTGISFKVNTDLSNTLYRFDTEIKPETSLLLNTNKNNNDNIPSTEPEDPIVLLDKVKNYILNLQKGKQNNDKRFLLSKEEIISMAPFELEEVKKQLKSSLKLIQSYEENKDLCHSCKTNKKNILFLPCKHCSHCDQCAPNIPQCPYCQTPITEKIQIFL